MTKFQRSNSKAGKLTAQQVLEIYKRRAAGESQGSLSRAFQISVGQMGKICRGEVWQELYNRFTQGLPLQPKDVDLDLALDELTAGIGTEAQPATGIFSKEAIKKSEQLLLDMLAQSPKGFTEAEPLDEGRSNELMTRLNSSISKETLK